MISRIKKRHIALLSLLVISAIVVLFLIQNDYQSDNSRLRRYDPIVDFIRLKSLIEHNKHYLPDAEDLSPEKMLLLLSAKDGKATYDDANIDVIITENKAVGLIVYKMLSPNQGRILLVIVDEAFRNRGYGTRLVNYAIDMLKATDAKVIDVAVPESNKHAQIFFKRLGFEESNQKRAPNLLILEKTKL